MSFRFIEDHRDAYPVRLMCAVLEVSPAGYYAWRERPVSARDERQCRAAGRDPAGPSGQRRRYGSPRVHAEAGPRRQPGREKRAACAVFVDI